MSKSMEPSERLTFSEQSRLDAWHKIAEHPFFKECYKTDDTLIEAMIAKLDDVHRYLTALDQYDADMEDEAELDREARYGA